MFNKNKCGNNAGIVAQQKWAKKRVEYLNSLPKQQGLFQDEVISTVIFTKSNFPLVAFLILWHKIGLRRLLPVLICDA
jgi:hypothetical protein